MCIGRYDIFTKGAGNFVGGEEGSLSSGHVCLKRVIIGINAFFTVR